MSKTVLNNNIGWFFILKEPIMVVNTLPTISDFLVEAQFSLAVLEVILLTCALGAQEKNTSINRPNKTITLEQLYICHVLHCNHFVS